MENKLDEGIEGVLKEIFFPELRKEEDNIIISMPLIIWFPSPIHQILWVVSKKRLSSTAT